VSGLSSFLLSIMMIAAFALAAGGIVTIRRGAERKKGVLMLVAALVLVGNVLILTL
jgi:hypothetical protein